MKRFMMLGAIVTALGLGASLGGATSAQTNAAESAAAGSPGTRAESLPRLTMKPNRASALVALATAKAEKHWGETRCETIEVDFRRLSDRRIAEAEWNASDLDPTVYVDCAITFDTTPISFEHFCATVVHEYGHLAGFSEAGGPDLGLHSRNKRKVMHPVITDRNVPKTCKTARTSSK